MRTKGDTPKIKCEHCEREISRGHMKLHVAKCYMHPDLKRDCPVCGEVIKDLNNKTCSYSCSNTLFRSGEDNPNWKNDNYRSTCFLHHGQKCIVCGEDKIVAVHHYDENHDNNDVRNLVPMCPTHHQYMHSRYAYIYRDMVDDYVRKFNLSFA